MRFHYLKKRRKVKKKFTSFITYMRTCHIFKAFWCCCFLKKNFWKKNTKSGYARFAKIFEEFHFIVIGMLNVFNSNFKQMAVKWSKVRPFVFYFSAIYSLLIKWEFSHCRVHKLLFKIVTVIKKHENKLKLKMLLLSLSL